MRISVLLKLLEKTGDQNFFILCPDEMGLSQIIRPVILRHAQSEDIYHLEADQITKEKARQLERDARTAPRGNSEKNHFLISGLQNLPKDSTGPLLKAVEESMFSRFIFQAQRAPRKLKTLRSRSIQVKLPFLPKKTILANLQALNLDAKTADQLNLVDGTLGGAQRALATKDTMTAFKRESSSGVRGLAALFQPEMLGSLVFDQGTRGVLTLEERMFLKRDNSQERKKLMIYRALTREGK